MKTYVSIIKGKKYVYAYDSIVITTKKRKQKIKLLGRIDDLAAASLKKEEFRNELQRIETEERIFYWEEKIRNAKFTQYCSIQKIEEYRSKVHSAGKEIGEHGIWLLEQEFRIDFIFHSNKIEGSKVPERAVEAQVKNPREHVSAEVQNTMKAMEYVSSDAFTFTTKKIVELHRILLGHEPHVLGIRREEVVVGNATVAPWQEIDRNMRDLLQWYKQMKHTMYPPELAFDFYYRFERIHPFRDGNGRVGRLLCNRILRDNGYHPMIIWTQRQKAHMLAFQKRMEGRGEYFYKFMEEECLKTYKIYHQKMQKALRSQESMIGTLCENI